MSMNPVGPEIIYEGNFAPDATAKSALSTLYGAFHDVLMLGQPDMLLKISKQGERSISLSSYEKCDGQSPLLTGSVVFINRNGRWVTGSKSDIPADRLHELCSTIASVQNVAFKSLGVAPATHPLIGEMTQGVGAITQKIKEFKAKITRLEQELILLKESKTVPQSEFDKLSEEKGHLERELKEWEEAFQDVVDVEEDGKVSPDQAKGYLRRNKEKLERLQSQLTAVEKEKTRLEASCRDMSHVIETLTSQLAGASGKVPSLKEELAQLRHAHALMQKQLEENHQAKKKLEAELTAHSKQNTQLQEEYDKLHYDYAELERTYLHLKHKTDQEKQEAPGKLHLTATTHRTEIEEKDREIASLNKELIELQSKLNVSTRVQATNGDKIIELQREIHDRESVLQKTRAELRTAQKEVKHWRGSYYRMSDSSSSPSLRRDEPPRTPSRASSSASSAPSNEGYETDRMLRAGGIHETPGGDQPYAMMVRQNPERESEYHCYIDISKQIKKKDSEEKMEIRLVNEEGDYLPYILEIQHKQPSELDLERHAVYIDRMGDMLKSEEEQVSIPSKSAPKVSEKEEKMEAGGLSVMRIESPFLTYLIDKDKCPRNFETDDFNLTIHPLPKEARHVHASPNRKLFPPPSPASSTESSEEASPDSEE